MLGWNQCFQSTFEWKCLTPHSLSLGAKRKEKKRKLGLSVIKLGANTRSCRWLGTARVGQKQPSAVGQWREGSVGARENYWVCSSGTAQIFPYMYVFLIFLIYIFPYMVLYVIRCYMMTLTSKFRAKFADSKGCRRHPFCKGIEAMSASKNPSCLLSPRSWVPSFLGAEPFSFLTDNPPVLNSLIFFII